MEPLPFKPRDWVSDDDGRVARVRAVHRFEDEVFLDLVMFEKCGEKVGRVSPALGGPKTFEPCCAADGWFRINEPTFPVPLKWVDDGNGRMIARHCPGDRLPPARYVPRERKANVPRWVADDEMKRALKAIADGHNDPRSLARKVLGRK